MEVVGLGVGADMVVGGGGELGGFIIVCPWGGWFGEEGALREAEGRRGVFKLLKRAGNSGGAVGETEECREEWK